MSKLRPGDNLLMGFQETSGPPAVTVLRGLKAMIKDISRQVIRYNPDDIYEFIADHLERKVLEREGKLLDVLLPPQRERRGSWQWMIWSWEGSSLLSPEDLTDFLFDIDVSFDVAQHAALVIQSCYRGYLGRKRVAGIQKDRQRMGSVWKLWLRPGSMTIDLTDVKLAEFILAHYGLILEEANTFATKIQAVIRGFLQRKGFSKAHPDVAGHLKKEEISQHEANAKATKIQSLFRGYKARKELKEKKLRQQERRITIMRGKSIAK